MLFNLWVKERYQNYGPWAECQSQLRAEPKLIHAWVNRSTLHCFRCVGTTWRSLTLYDFSQFNIFTWTDTINRFLVILQKHTECCPCVVMVFVPCQGTCSQTGSTLTFKVDTMVHLGCVAYYRQLDSMAFALCFQLPHSKHKSEQLSATADGRVRHVKYLSHLDVVQHQAFMWCFSFRV